MAHQSPMISIPKKVTDEVDWTTPIRHLIAQSYGESPDNYAQECAALQRCRQDAVRGAGSDTTARDLLYKYFGQLELLELRFSEIKVTFPWRDAFTQKLTTQTSIAFEKASILFQIAATHSSIAASQSRSDPEGLKRAFYYFRTCAGMLNYINENFLHAPSTDLSRDVVKFLVNVILAQATEVFFEKCTDEKKGNQLVSKVASQTASMYTTLCEDVKEFMGKGIFDRNWVTLIQTKSKYFTSLAQYYRGLADDAAGKHGEALVRFTQAETLAKEANRQATVFSAAFSSTMSPTLPPDAGTTLVDRTKAHLVICSERKAEAQRENDLIYNAVLPAPEALPPIDKLVVAQPIHIHEVYGTPEVQKTIGQDIFLRLIPLSVHESASVYSEEKAKLVRGEVEKADAAEAEGRSAIDGLGVRQGLARFKAMAEGEVGGDEEIPTEVRRWKEDITVIEDRESVESLMAQLNKLKASVQQDLEGVSRDLEIESKECEVLRVKYDHLWTQGPSAGLTKSIRADLKSHFGALEAASASDSQVVNMWNSIKSDIALLRSPQLEQVFRDQGSQDASLLDLDVSSEVDEAKERAKIRGYVDEIEDRLKRVNMISRERNEVLKDLKDKVQADDVSHLLLLNKRNTGIEPTLFAAELEKFRPYQQRLAATVHHQDVAIQELTALWKGLKDLAGRGPGARKWEEREKKKNDTVRRFSRARDVYMEVRDGLTKGLQFYSELTDLTKSLKDHAHSFLNERKAEREDLVSKIELEKKLSGTSTTQSAPPPVLPAKPPAPPPRPPSSSLDSTLAALSLSSPPPQSPPPPPQQPQQQRWSGSYGAPQPSPPPPQPPSHYPPSQYQHHQYPGQAPPPPPPGHYTPGPASAPPPGPPSHLPPPPPRPTTQSSMSPSGPSVDPYASLSLFGSSFSSNPNTNTPQQQQQQQPGVQTHGYGQLPPPPPPPHQQHQQHYQYQQGQGQGQLPPPPPPQQQQYQYGGAGNAGGFPPPPPPPPGGYGYQPQQQPQQQQQYGYGAPPPPPPQQQQQYHSYGQYGGGYQQQ
ncbi:vacuolar protein-sorting protein BRO1 [Coprinopsis cinerea okayama7|uniref:BRO domain-containing protein 1 n=1 Tax=Coprinopsis cinerea (strain Okayama-7 / 130 / ATCC MYA-4618 / FGSC 9003) TaxID=240176 RepID=D6RNC0_COPC7|nr:vacuolar protein-sorting protein BRO1 [Coprinopsis cinerea okayama7\|eukprot:XP_002911036.1 vacuolar protein-sorting protein BRO1 [Coprinopsis cinerea okayama7\